MAREDAVTKQQKIYFDAIERYIKKNGCSPSYQEIGKMVGIRSLSSVSKMVDRLVRAGYLVKGRYSTARNLAIVPGKLHGFNVCERNHPLIYFLEEVCPLCSEIQKHTPPREIHKGTTFPQG